LTYLGWEKKTDEKKIKRSKIYVLEGLKNEFLKSIFLLERKERTRLMEKKVRREEMIGLTG